MTRWTKEYRDGIRRLLPERGDWLGELRDALDQIGELENDLAFAKLANEAQETDRDALMLVAQRFELDLNDANDRREDLEGELQDSEASSVELRVLRRRAEAERDELGEELLRLEWSARSGLKPACPRCGVSIDWWHATGCTLGALCNRIRARKLSADAPPPQASTEKGAPRPDPLRNEVVSAAPAGAPEAGPFPAPPGADSRKETRACAPHAAVVAAPTGATTKDGSLTSTSETPRDASERGGESAPLRESGPAASSGAAEASRVEALEAALRKIQSHLLDSDSRDFKLAGRLGVASMLAIIGRALHGDPCPNATTGGG